MKTQLNSFLCTLVVVTCLLPGASAGETTSKQAGAGVDTRASAGEASSKQEVTGFGTGAIIGASAGGPIGAIIGAAIGAYLGDTHHQLDSTKGQLQDERLALEKAHELHLNEQTAKLSVEQRLLLAHHEIESLNAQVQVLHTQRDLLTGMHYEVFFATNEAEFDEHELLRLGRLAQLVKATPEAVVELSGYADRRGSANYNETLSLDRAYAVADALNALGVHQKQLRTFAYGNSDSQGKAIESYALDRRVSIRVSVPTAEPSLAVGAMEITATRSRLESIPDVQPADVRDQTDRQYTAESASAGGQPEDMN